MDDGRHLVFPPANHTLHRTGPAVQRPPGFCIENKDDLVMSSLVWHVIFAALLLQTCAESINDRLYSMESIPVTLTSKQVKTIAETLFIDKR